MVTVVRSFLEGEGVDFSAKMAGKLKMVFQCAAVVISLLVLSSDANMSGSWMHWLLVATAWLAVGSTIYSGVGYVWQAIRLVGPKANS